MRLLRVIVLALVLLFAASSVIDAQLVRKIVVFDEGIDENTKTAILELAGAKVLKDLSIINAKAVLLPNQAVSALAKIRGVKRIDPDVLVFALPQTMPWGVERIHAPEAWQISTGSGVKVGVIDTGISTKHPDLKVYGGINTINPKKSYNDDNGHGSHVAGTIAALNNSIGVVGVAHSAKLYAVKALNASSLGYLSDLLEGLDWCLVNGMNVVNMSLGTSSDVPSLHEAVEKLYNAGIVQVAAAGNNYGGPILYPAAYEEVIAVTATDQNDLIAPFSSCGPEADLSAPGVNILSTYKGTSYARMSGTSMSAPHVTGVVALLIAKGESGVERIKEILYATAFDPNNNGWDPCYGYGIVDAYAAVTYTGGQAPPRVKFVPLSARWGEIKSK